MGPPVAADHGSPGSGRSDRSDVPARAPSDASGGPVRSDPRVRGDPCARSGARGADALRGKIRRPRFQDAHLGSGEHRGADGD
ncbi:hypothetical protein, partial [Actinomadura sp. NPDC049753]|uniref:hypothetical protein n=1 Tax=Actinomadura sp. NPDC049753 TaxID=3154739 RepID=UPI003437B657